MAITGTNGKTTTSALLAGILEEDGYKVGVSSTAFFKIGQEYVLNNLNMTVTNPFSLQKTLRKMNNAQVDIVILETTSHALMQYRVWGIKPILALITNLTQDHLDYHGTMENYAAAKGKLFAMKPNLIALNQDDDWFEFYDKYEAVKKKLSYGTAKHSGVRLTKAALKKDHSELSVSFEGAKSQKFTTHLVGKFNSYNALAAITAAHLMEVHADVIANGLLRTTHVPGRMEAVEAGQNYSVYIDYAHTPDALQNVLETLQAITKGRIITVFGATGDRDKGKRPDMGAIVAANSDVAILTDDEPYTEDPKSIREDVAAGFTSSKHSCETHNIGNRKKAIELAVSTAKKGDAVLVTGIGHQSFRVVGTKKQKWSERKTIESAIKQT